MLYSFYSAAIIIYAADSRITRRAGAAPLPDSARCFLCLVSARRTE